jgi:hypothetical protein
MFERATSVPKMSLPSLEPKTNVYVVPEGGLYHYYSIRIKEDTIGKPIMRFEKAPPILMDGIVILNRTSMYQVSHEDILRGIVRASNKIIIERDSNGSATSESNPCETDATSSSNVPHAPVQYQVERGTVGASDVEIDQAADDAWEEQVESLLCHVSAKEGGEWEVSDVAQS